ncbi:helix-turn-helix transcriptional regulator [Phreatobacter sp. AB_2022a]|uniref:helix-turn-helix transcriptional regulator n=1 Tax=Phreatobacter sp. AB_2022a TaxID=3003134 RepID=UPI002287597E|nr:helix-turn-helix transcriptional regulator [Phreatobacter sp. AB_2022a]MCZ0734767.1 helix-turn-helix transcriptional regulator [Phreatobacter sp. AB_2022a]
MAENAVADLIYEAAFNPDQWLPVLDRLGDVGGAAGGCIALVNGQRLLGLRNSEIIRRIGGDLARNPDPRTFRRLDYLRPDPPPGFIVTSTFFPQDILDTDPFIHIKQTHGLAEEAATYIPLPSGELAMVSLDRRTENGPFLAAEIARLDALRPHLARASLVSARLRMEQARATVSTLQALGIPAAVLARSGRVLAGNDELERIADRLVPVAFGGMAIAHPSANRLFQDAVRLSHRTDDDIVRSIPVPAADDAPALVVHILPLKRSAHDIFSGADVLVAVSVVGADQGIPSPAVLAGLFDLTPAEARLAAALTSGTPLKAAAAANGIKFTTARSYLEKIFRKTGTNQQSQLVTLLKTVRGALPRPAA